MTQTALASVSRTRTLLDTFCGIVEGSQTTDTTTQTVTDDTSATQTPTPSFPRAVTHSTSVKGEEKGLLVLSSYL